MSDSAPNILEKLAAELDSLTEDDPPERATDVFFRAGAVLCTTALHVHPNVPNYLATRVLDDTSGRGLTVYAAWDDGVAPLHKLELLEQAVQELAAAGNETALGAIARVRAQPGRIRPTDVADLRAAALLELPVGAHEIERLRERMPSAGPIVDALAVEVVRLVRGLALLEREHHETRPLVRMLLAGLTADEAERAYSSAWK